MTSGIDDTNIVKKIMGQRLTDVRKARGLTRQGAVDALNESEFAPSFERRKFLGIETYKKWEYGKILLILNGFQLYVKYIPAM